MPWWTRPGRCWSAPPAGTCLPWTWMQGISRSSGSCPAMGDLPWVRKAASSARTAPSTSGATMLLQGSFSARRLRFRKALGIHALLQRLAAAEHHGGGGAKPKRVRGAVHVDPFGGRALEPADAVADAIVQNLRAAAGDGIDTRVAQAGDGVAQTQAADFGDVGNLRR